MNSAAAKNIENQTLGLTAVIYCVMMLASLAVGLYGVFTLYQFVFGSIEQTARMTPWV
jgi:hypothetical protein